MKKELPDIYWIGGSPCAGKTSISRILGEKFNMEVYHTDEHYLEHVRKCSPKFQPTMYKLAPMSEDEFWMRPIKQQVEEEFSFYKEEFEFILEDLSVKSSDKKIIVEGTGLLPKLVVNVLKNVFNAIWIIPTEEFQRKMYPIRGDGVAEKVKEILKQCRNPEQAFDNWMTRDVEYAKIIEKDVNDLNLKIIKVDGTKSIIEYSKEVEEYFQLKI